MKSFSFLKRALGLESMSGLKVIYILINSHRCLVTPKSRDHWKKSNLAQGKTGLAFKMYKGESKMVILSKKRFEAKVQISAVFLGIKVVLRISLKSIHRVDYISEPCVCLCSFFLLLSSPALVAELIPTAPQGVPKTTAGSEPNRAWYSVVSSTGLGIQGAGMPPGCPLLSQLWPGLKAWTPVKQSTTSSQPAEQPDDKTGLLCVKCRCGSTIHLRI